MKSIIISLLTALMLICPAAVNAQTGSWEIFPVYSMPKKMIDTPDYLFILSNNSLVGLDKQTNEFINFDTTNYLNSNKVLNAWYSPVDGILFVAHTNGMIDLVYDDGRTVNIADLTNTTIDYGTINDVDFRDGKAYLALSKGIIVIDMPRALIDHVGLYLKAGTGYGRIAVTDSKVIVAFDVNGRILVADRKGNLSANIFRATNNNLYRASNTDLGEIYGLDGDKYLTVGSAQNNLELAVTSIDPNAENGAASVSKPVKLGPNCFASRLQPAKDGFVGNNTSQLFYINRQGEITRTVNFTIPEFSNTAMIVTNSDSSQSDAFWYADANGVGRRALDGSFVIPQMSLDATVTTNVGQFAPASDGRIYFSTVRRDNDFGGSIQPDFSKAYFGCIHPDGTVSSFDPNVTSKYDLVANPLNPDEVVISHRNGIVRYNTKTKESTTYNASNTPMQVDWTPNQTLLLVYGLTFDPKGNLWVLQNNNGNHFVYMIPAADWNNGAPSAKWKTIRIGSPELWHSSIIRYAPGPDGKGYILIGGSGEMGCINLNGTFDDLSDDTIRFSSVTSDTDGMALTEGLLSQFAPDNSGMVWIAYQYGVLHYPNIATIFTTSPYPTRAKVARNDGTDLADYLLTNIKCYDVSVDANNNKWVATIGSGLYRVSPDGSEIIEHLTTDNSDLPSDNVIAVYADPESNKVYVGTDLGLAIYHSGSTPARKDFDDVYAYPNPVTPEYTGYITVTGLMADSLVKITDSAGRVVFEGRSDGGSVVWDGFDGSGSRVKSGVYFVYASSSASGSAQAAVTKIVVVN
ncbi:MAG: hypothetical protein K2G15_01800 [Muribaculaceae bacterium]|nr:hypothetical protein [Muribaculaceae bacterium]